MDCIYKSRECERTTQQKCSDECRWRQTEAEMILGRSRSIKRLRSLPENKQQEIADKYYGGEKPWR